MHHVAYVIYPGTQIFSTAPLSVFEIANVTLERPFYDARVLSENGGPVRTSFGISIETEPFSSPDFDTLLVGAGALIEESTPGLRDFIRAAAVSSRRIAAPCTGAFTLAQAGILDGR